MMTKKRHNLRLNLCILRFHPMGALPCIECRGASGPAVHRVRTGVTASPEAVGLRSQGIGERLA